MIVGNFHYVKAEEATVQENNPKAIQSTKVDKAKSTADKQLEQRIESLNKLKERISSFKNISENDVTTMNTFISNVVIELNDLKATIDNATSSDDVKESREKINKNYRIYALVIPQLSIIASADRMTTMISMLNIVASKMDVRINAVATGTDITTANLTSAKKALSDMKDKLVLAQGDVQSAVSLVAPLVPDQGDKAVMEVNLKAMKDARAKIKSAQANLVTARKDAETIAKILSKEKKPKPSNTASTTIPVKSTDSN